VHSGGLVPDHSVPQDDIYRVLFLLAERFPSVARDIATSETLAASVGNVLATVGCHPQRVASMIGRRDITATRRPVDVLVSRCAAAIRRHHERPVRDAYPPVLEVPLAAERPPIGAIPPLPIWVPGHRCGHGMRRRTVMPYQPATVNRGTALAGAYVLLVLVAVTTVATRVGDSDVNDAVQAPLPAGAVAPTRPIESPVVADSPAPSDTALAPALANPTLAVTTTSNPSLTDGSAPTSSIQTLSVPGPAAPSPVPPSTAPTDVGPAAGQPPATGEVPTPAPTEAPASVDVAATETANPTVPEGGFDRPLGGSSQPSNETAEPGGAPAVGAAEPPVVTSEPEQPTPPRPSKPPKRRLPVVVVVAAESTVIVPTVEPVEPQNPTSPVQPLTGADVSGAGVAVVGLVVPTPEIAAVPAIAPAPVETTPTASADTAAVAPLASAEPVAPQPAPTAVAAQPAPTDVTAQPAEVIAAAQTVPAAAAPDPAVVAAPAVSDVASPAPTEPVVAPTAAPVDATTVADPAAPAPAPGSTEVAQPASEPINYARAASCYEGSPIEASEYCAEPEPPLVVDASVIEQVERGERQVTAENYMAYYNFCSANLQFYESAACQMVMTSGSTN
jgi:hypothetical protein